MSPPGQNPFAVSVQDQRSNDHSEEREMSPGAEEMPGRAMPTRSGALHAVQERGSFVSRKNNVGSAERDISPAIAVKTHLGVIDVRALSMVGRQKPEIGRR